MGYPQIVIFLRDFNYKATTLGEPHVRKHLHMSLVDWKPKERHDIVCRSSQQASAAFPDVPRVEDRNGVSGNGGNTMRDPPDDPDS